MFLELPLLALGTNKLQGTMGTATATLMMLRGRTLLDSTAVAKTLNFSTNIASLLVFLAVGKVVWLDHLLGAYDVFLSYVGVQSKADTWDCENYSGMLNAITTLRIWRAGFLDTRAAIGWLRVDAKHSWAGLPAELHALMFAVTSEGVFIIEPQNGQYCSLSNYHNRKYIEEVYLF